MPDALVLDSLDAYLDRVVGGRALINSASRVELSWLQNAYVTSVAMYAQPPGLMVTEFGILTGAAGATLAELGPVQVTLATPDDRLLILRFTTALGAGVAGGRSLALSATLEIFDLILAVELNQPWLRTVNADTGQAAGARLRIEIDAMLRVETGAPPAFRVYGFSIPPTAVGNTGLIVSLDDCQVALGGNGVPLSLLDLSGSPDFDGLYARRAQLSWLPKLRFPGGEWAGFRLNFRDVLIEPDGFSFVLDEHWAVRRAQGAPHRLAPQSEMLGRLLGDRLRIAIESATGSVVRNQPTDFLLTAWLELPGIEALLRAELEVDTDPQADSGSVGLTLTQEQGSTIQVDLGIGNLTVENLSAIGTLDGDQFVVSGSCQFAISLPGWNSAAVDLEAQLSVSKESIGIGVALPELALGPLGNLANTRFSFAFAHHADGSAELTDFAIQSTLLWRDLRSRLQLGALPPNLPQPPDDGSVQALIRWTRGGTLELVCEVEADDPHSIFNFLPTAFRPVVRAVGFGIRATYADARDFFTAQPNADVSATAFARIEFKPAFSPELLDTGILTVRTGDAYGFIAAELNAEVGVGGDSLLSLSITSPVKIDFAIPGLTHEPLLTLAWTKAEMTMSESPRGQHDTVTMKCAGDFSINASAIEVNSSVAPQLISLLQPLLNLELRGSATADLTLKDDRASLTLKAGLDDAGFEFDILELIGQFAGGAGSSTRVATGSQRSAKQEAALDLDFRFVLTSLDLSIGTIDPQAGESIPASAALNFSAEFSGARIDAFVRISSEELAIGVAGAKIPLSVPQFPLTPDDLTALGNPDWTLQGFEAALVVMQDRIDELAAPCDRRGVERLGRALARKAMVDFLYRTWRSLSNDNARHTYQSGASTIVAAFAEVAARTRLESAPRLESGGAKLRIPLRDPRQIAVEGSASLQGFEDPLDGLNGVTLDLGISPDQIYFGLTGSGKPVQLPTVGRYRNGYVNLTQFTIGYGFTRNSLALSFAGELKYPDHLNEDIDTSRRIGFGIKPPQYNRLAFRLDLIPVPGPIPVVPVFEFSLDLRAPGVPAIGGTQICEPLWDGLQLHIPGVIRTDLKMAAVSPIFGIIPAINFRFDWDIDIGDERSGLTLVCDDMLAFAGITTHPMPTPIPYLIDPAAPYFEHLCVNARVAGFGINIDIERPFPLPNPLLVFDVLALISDPLRPLDPGSPLARLMRLTVRDAYITIPLWARPLIPGGAHIVRNELNFEINANTLLSATQWIGSSFLSVVQAAQDAFAVGQQAIDNLRNHPPHFDSGELLKMLPPQLRTLKCELSFGGFDASAALILMSPSDARRDNAYVDGLWALPALQGFDRRDLDPLPASTSSSAVMAAANIEILNTDSYRFFGFIADDGTFGLVTAGNVEPLSLAINGIEALLPLEFSGRLMLSGQVSARRRFAEVRAQGRGEWEIVRDVVRVAAGVREPVELKLSSTGRFTIAGDGAIEFFDGVLRIVGALEASESHLGVSGTMDLQLDGRQNEILGVHAEGLATVGPGAAWSFTGNGQLRLFDLVVSQVAYRLSNRELAVRFEIDRRKIRVGSLRVDTMLSADFEGALRFPRNATPSLRLSGRGSLAIGDASLSGALSISAGSKALSMSASGDLYWLGKKWLGAHLSASSDGRIRLGGRVSAVLDLTPSGEVLTGVQVASLFLRIDLDADLRLGPDFDLTHQSITLDWSLGLRFPGAEKQTFVLAMQKVKIAPGDTLDHSMIAVNGMQFIPLDDVVIPVPRLVSDGDVQLITAHLNVIGLSAVPFIMTHSIRNAIEEVTDENFVYGSKNFLKIPKDLSLKFDNQPLGKLTADLGFSIRLKWNGKLGVEIRTGQQHTFVGLDKLL